MPTMPFRAPDARRSRALIALPLLIAACSGGTSSLPPAGSPGPSAVPPSAAPSVTPAPTVGAIEHKTGATDVVLRLEEGGGFVPIDFLASQAPTFTLYGDGIIVFQPKVETFPQPDAAGVVHSIPWRTAKLDETQIQDLLAFALGAGGLGPARDSYIDGGIADAPNTIFTVRAGGLDKTVVINALGGDFGQGQPDAQARASFLRLAERLRDFDNGGSIPTDVYTSDRYRGVLMEREAQPEPKPLAWPWPALKATDFKAEQTPDGGTSLPRRVLSTAEVDALGIKDSTGGLQGIVLTGPDGKSYSLIVRPLLAEEKG
jgi:hypothetical protein